MLVQTVTYKLSYFLEWISSGKFEIERKITLILGLLTCVYVVYNVFFHLLSREVNEKIG